MPAATLGIMQPYFLPYLGYFQLVRAVDAFVIYDNIEFSKGGWVQRNRILLNGTDSLFSLPIKKDSDYLDIRDRRLADTFPAERVKLLRRIDAAYRRAPHYAQTMPLVEACVMYESDNLFEFIRHSVQSVSEHLGITTRFVVSSTLPSDRHLKGQDRVLAICRDMDCRTYVNAINGRTLYDRPTFTAQGVDLKFIQMRSIEYPQFGNSFIPNLSIVDVLMFNPLDRVREFLTAYELV